MIYTKRLYLDNAKESDIEAIMEMENEKENRNFVCKGTFEEHKTEIENDDFYIFVIKQKYNHENVGFILINLDNKSERFELRRIVISKKGMGYGKEVMAALFKFAFEELNMNRFWLDVYPDNSFGIKLYEGVGMHKDGVLRQNYKSERGYLDQIIYSMLKSEYYQILLMK
ncbi:MAG: GNAT family protein [Sedimentibacter sp.]|uniref:GNAT family N-acetyltransferase n=1 Tax=Sedimentibacter sp. TaxID=1960295 RepID=UPI0029816203|nr:GNAT family protein [Sedimentibacter sp.]MDW5299895.1 GNAT family protein [Sedimentibacter sp.]